MLGMAKNGLDNVIARLLGKKPVGTALSLEGHHIVPTEWR
jgi:hypothetical protein